MQFDEAFQILVNPQHEGGYSNTPGDPGGETKYGISKHAFPQENIPAVTLERAKFLYRVYWSGVSADSLPDTIRYEMFDLGVNAGPGRAVKLMQRALGVAEDGVIGPKTLLSISSAEPNKLLRKLQGHRLLYYTGLGHDWWAEFGRGVTTRVATNMTEQ